MKTMNGTSVRLVRTTLGVVLLTVAASGCSKKAEECLAVTPPLPAVHQAINIDVATDEDAPMRSKDLGALIAAATSAQTALGALHPTDKELAKRLATYSKDLAALLDVAQRLKPLCDQQVALAKRIGLEFPVLKETTDAYEDLLRSEGITDLEANVIDLFVVTFKDPEVLAAKLEKVTVRSSASKVALQRYIVALRALTKLHRDNADITSKLEALESDSKKTRDEFAGARTALVGADDAITEYCKVK